MTAAPLPPPVADPRDHQSVLSSVAATRAGLEALREEIGIHVAGQESVVSGVLTCLIADGHALLEGVPGTGKTLLVKTIAAAAGLDVGRMQFTPDLMPADITGTTVMAEGPRGRGSVFRRGPIFHAVVLADEINRASPRTQSALLEAMQERTVTVGGTTHPLPRPFIVLATQNPIEQEGTHKLPEAQVDRFLMNITVRPPERAVLERIIEQTTGATGRDVRIRIAPGFLEAASQLSRRILVAPHVDNWIASIVLGTGDASIGGEVAGLVLSPCSPRAAIAVRMAAQVQALAAGRLAASCDDVSVVVPACLRHRLVANPAARGRGLSSDDLIVMLLQHLPRPAEEVGS